MDLIADLHQQRLYVANLYADTNPETDSYIRLALKERLSEIDTRIRLLRTETT